MDADVFSWYRKGVLGTNGLKFKISDDVFTLVTW